MKLIKSGLLLILLPGLATASVQSATTQAEGALRFQGIIIAEACRVEAGDQQMTVNMGQISSNRFHTVGEDSNPVAFDIHLQDCSTAISQRVSVTFHGVTDYKYTDVLSAGDAPGVARGVGIVLFDKDGKQILLSEPSESKTLIHDGPTTLHFVAKYRATENQVVGGVVNSQAWFSLTYQ